MGETEKAEVQEVQASDDGSVVTAQEESVVEVLPYKGKKRGRKPGTGIPKLVREKAASKRKAEILELSAAGVPVKDIATITKCHATYVKRIRREFRPAFKSLTKIDNFRSIKADILDAAQLEMLKSAVTPTKMRKAPLGQLAYAFRQFYDAGRLESGKSTQNTAVSFTNKSS